jgi:antitoxin ChpS
MLLATLRTVGGSVMFTIPKQILRGLGLSANRQVGVTVFNGRLIVEPSVTTLRTVGKSVMFAIPKPILEGLGLSANTQVGLTISEGRLIVEPHPKPRYTLAELMEQCDLSAPHTEESRAWLDAGLAGREIL